MPSTQRSIARTSQKHGLPSYTPIHSCGSEPCICDIELNPWRSCYGIIPAEFPFLLQPPVLLYIVFWGSPPLSSSFLEHMTLVRERKVVKIASENFLHLQKHWIYPCVTRVPIKPNMGKDHIREKAGVGSFFPKELVFCIILLYEWVNMGFESLQYEGDCTI